MKIDLTLDYHTILRNEPRPVHLVATLCAPKLEVHTRSRSAAFAVVLGGVAPEHPNLTLLSWRRYHLAEPAADLF
jgi:hypothetical protein